MKSDNNVKPLMFFYILLMAGVQSSWADESKLNNHETSKKPNVLFLLADDLGYGELGSYGQKRIKTPHLDALAKAGKRFTNFYAGNAVCSPSRAVLMTGKHSGHATIRGNKGLYGDGGWRRVSLEKDELTIGQMMQHAGYQTAFIGKWHLENASDLDTWAYARGFDYAVQEQWKMSNSKIYFDERKHWINGVNEHELYDYTKWDNLDQFRTNFALSFLETKRDESKPFFLVMSYRAPHGHEKLIRNKSFYADQGWPEEERHHAAKITLLDVQVGRIVEYLKRSGQYENTLIIFTSDNGGHSEGHDYQFFASNGKLKGFKRDLYEGGIRVPKIAVWENKIAANTVSEHIGAFQDFMPTFAEIAGVNIPGVTDGISMLGTYLNKPQQKHEFLYWEEAKQKNPETSLYQAIRHGDWKAVRYGLKGEVEIYNLATDESEQDNLAKQHPEKVQYYKNLFKNTSTPVEHYPFTGQAD